MAKDRPDIYTPSSAMDDLVDRMNSLRDSSGNLVLSGEMSGGFVLLRIVEDEGMEEFQLTRCISSVTTFLPEEDCLVAGWVDDIDLPNPGVEVDNDDEDV